MKCAMFARVCNERQRFAGASCLKGQRAACVACFSPMSYHCARATVGLGRLVHRQQWFEPAAIFWRSGWTVAIERRRGKEHRLSAMCEARGDLFLPWDGCPVPPCYTLLSKLVPGERQAHIRTDTSGHTRDFYCLVVWRL